MMQTEITAMINALGVFAFAFTGSLRAIEAGMDLLGILTLGITTALGGGMLRDVLVNRIPYAFQSSSDVLTAVFGVIIAVLTLRTMRKDFSNTYLIRIADTMGLAAFTSTGAMIAYYSDLSLFGIIMLATLTACGGGIISDLFSSRIPAVLTENFYATCAIAGAISFYLCTINHINPDIGSMLCSILVIVLRTMAIRYQWHLPKIRHHTGG
jgi:uncharacterized membrane protein YeiH